MNSSPNFRPELIPLANPAADMLPDLDAFKAVLERVLRSGSLVLGPEVDEFELEFARMLRFDGAVVSCGNGTDALALAIRSLGLTSGAKIGLAPNAGFYGTLSALSSGLRPMFADVGMETGSLTLESAKLALSEGAEALIVTHLYGLANPEIQQIAELCISKNVPLIEDCAQAHGAQINSQSVGTFGKFGTFSFYPSKNLGGIGDGGAVVTKSGDLESELRSLRQYGWAEKYNVVRQLGMNSRLDEVQAGFLRILLRELETKTKRRTAIARLYLAALAENPNIMSPSEGEDGSNVWHLFVLRTSAQARPSLISHLEEAGVSSGIHYPIPDDTLRPDLDSVLGGTPNSLERSKSILSIPIYPSMTDSQAHRVASALASWSP